jgi:hypothetical protein
MECYRDSVLNRIVKIPDSICRQEHDISVIF